MGDDSWWTLMGEIVSALGYSSTFLSVNLVVVLCNGLILFLLHSYRQGSFTGHGESNSRPTDRLRRQNVTQQNKTKSDRNSRRQMLRSGSRSLNPSSQLLRPVVHIPSAKVGSEVDDSPVSNGATLDEITWLSSHGISCKDTKGYRHDKPKEISETGRKLVESLTQKSASKSQKMSTANMSQKDTSSSKGAAKVNSAVFSRSSKGKSRWETKLSCATNNTQCKMKKSSQVPMPRSSTPKDKTDEGSLNQTRDSWIWFSLDSPSNAENFASRQDRFRSKDPRVSKLMEEIHKQDEMNEYIKREAETLVKSSKTSPAAAYSKNNRKRTATTLDVTVDKNTIRVSNDKARDSRKLAYKRSKREANSSHRREDQYSQDVNKRPVKREVLSARTQRRTRNDKCPERSKSASEFEINGTLHIHRIRPLSAPTTNHGFGPSNQSNSTTGVAVRCQAVPRQSSGREEKMCRDEQSPPCGQHTDDDYIPSHSPYYIYEHPASGGSPKIIVVPTKNRPVFTAEAVRRSPCQREVPCMVERKESSSRGSDDKKRPVVSPHWSRSAMLRDESESDSNLRASPLQFNVQVQNQVGKEVANVIKTILFNNDSTSSHSNTKISSKTKSLKLSEFQDMLSNSVGSDNKSTVVYSAIPQEDGFVVIQSRQKSPKRCEVDTAIPVSSTNDRTNCSPSTSHGRVNVFSGNYYLRKSPLKTDKIIEDKNETVRVSSNYKNGSGRLGRSVSFSGVPKARRVFEN